MSPLEAVQSVFTNYVNFSGRASRSEFWWWIGFSIMVFFLLGLAVAIDWAIALLLMVAWYGVTFIPNLAVIVRRLHDTGRSGWWILIAFVPLLNLLLLVFYVLDSQAGPNRWGPPPRGSRYYTGEGWTAAAATAPGEWAGASSFGTGTAVGSDRARTKIFSGYTTADAEAAFRADLAAAAAAGYQPVSQRWDTTQMQPTLVVDYEPVSPTR